MSASSSSCSVPTPPRTTLSSNRSSPSGTNNPRLRSPEGATSIAPKKHIPNLGLVCLTVGPEVRYRTITRTRCLLLAESDRVAKLDELYRHNLQILFGALDYCSAHGIKLYRVISQLLPQIDHPSAAPVLRLFHDAMSSFGKRARKLGIRIVAHPDQFVVLSSENPNVVQNSIQIMSEHAMIFDLLGLPRSPWSALILHGGKSGRAGELIDVIKHLPPNIKKRLVLENDEYAYSAAEILEICHAAKIPMVFDAHHHVIHEKLDSYEDPSIAHFTRLARQTWPQEDWQIVHISNGQSSFRDPRHHDYIKLFPSAFMSVDWIEVEAKAKEKAISRLQKSLQRR